MNISTLPIPAIRHKVKIFPCPHLHTTIDTIGSIQFYAGDVIDTTEDRLICSDCGANLDTLQPAREQIAIAIVELAQ